MAGFFDLSAYNIERGDERSYTPAIHDCKACGRHRTCNTPKAPAIGNGAKKILVIGPEMTALEDRKANEVHGTHYKYVKKQFKKVGIDLEEDCWYTHAIRCYGDKEGAIVSSACHAKLIEEVKALSPRVIVTTCQQAFDILLYDRMAGRAATASYMDWCGELIPDQVIGTFILPVYPSETMLKEAEGHNDRYELFYLSHLRKIPEILKMSFPKYDVDSKCVSCYTPAEVDKALEEIATWPKFAFDYETTGIKPHRKGHTITYVSASNGKVSYAFAYGPTVKDRWAKIMANDATKIAHNQSFERSWTENIVGVRPNGLTEDTMIGQHCFANKKPTGLKFLTYAHYGILGYDTDADEFLKPCKEEQDKYGANAINRAKEAPSRKMLKYNAMDSLFTYWLYEDVILELDPVHQMPGYRFFMESQPAFDRAHENGMNIDMALMKTTEEKLTKDIQRYEKLIMNDDLIIHTWDGSEFNPASDKDVRHLLFDILKYEIHSRTDSGLPAVDAESLLVYKDRCPLASHLLGYRRYKKARDTYIAQNKREVVDGVVHGFFGLGNVATFRSNARNPNQQNIPKRDKETKKIIRSLYRPLPGNRLIEYDFKGAEVSASAAISGDKNLIKYVTDLSLDMHRDLATGLFFLPKEKIAKTIRGDLTKGPWTFAQFYGSWYKDCAENIWQMLQVPGGEARYGIDLLAHLAENGIENLDDWIEHCKEQEDVLWGKEYFAGYQRFRDSTFDFFKEHGYIDYVNGFRYYGPATRNECLNAPIQGPAFHIQLWAFTQVTREIEERGMKSRLVGSIHDALVGDVPPEEETYFDHLVWKYATQDVKEFYPWINVPLMIEKERSEIDGSWAKMEAQGYLEGR